MEPVQSTACKGLLFSLITTLVVACSDGSSSGSSSGPVSTFNADIVWTEYGIPHITAEDWGSLGYGTGYAYAQQNFCRAMEEVVRFNGESARYLGGSQFEDLYFKWGFNDDLIQENYLADPTSSTAQMITGYAAGMNRYLRETGPGNLAQGDHGCRNAQWVREVTALDIAKVTHRLSNWNSPMSEPFLQTAVFAATPPELTAQAHSPAHRKRVPTELDRERFIASIPPPLTPKIGSNSYAIGGDASQTGAGIVLDNPHLYWDSASYFMAHQTMGDELDMMGTLTAGHPFMQRGFNKDIAWSHTISYGYRFMLYELELNPENPLQYLYDGKIWDIEPTTVSAEYVDANGEVQVLNKTFYSSHLGPIMDPGSALGGWPTPMGTVMTIFLPTAENYRRPEELVRMAQSSNMGEFKEAIRSVGLDGVHTLAADRHGDAFYGDIAVTPNISNEQIAQCVQGVLVTALMEAGIPALALSDPACAPGNDPETAPGVRGFDKLPQLDTREYVANANQGFSLINPRMPIEGFPEFMGGDVGRNIYGRPGSRVRQLFRQAEQRLEGSDDLGAPGFNVDNIRELLLGSRAMVAEFITDDLVAICRAVEDWSPYTSNTASAAQACDVLADWDRRFLPESVGAAVYREYADYRVFHDRPTEASYRVPWDPTDTSFATPYGLIMTDEWIEATRRSLARAVDVLVAAGVPIDAPLSVVQYVEKGGVRYPMSGTHDSVLNIFEHSQDEESFLENGYVGTPQGRIFGNTYVSAVTWDGTDCPDAYSVLTLSQSSDPASPHYADGTRLYSEGGWIDMPFCEADRDAQEIRRESISE